jgi:hypothetical protein
VSEGPRFIRGVPYPLPDGETLLWEGAPQARPVAMHVFRLPWFAAYLVAMILLWLAETELAFGSSAFFGALAVRVALSATVMAIIAGLSITIARTSWYAITNRRLVLRLGMVLPMTLNIPFTVLESAGVGVFRDGTGQLVLRLIKAQRIAYIALWPHCRAFRITHPEPVLRGLAEPQAVARILADAVAAHGNVQSRVPTERPAESLASVSSPAMSVS